MTPHIDGTAFGSITITEPASNTTSSSARTVTKRKKKLSKAIYGTSHTISIPEVNQVFAQGQAGGLRKL
jgi:hypothetical protein